MTKLDLRLSHIHLRVNHIRSAVKDLENAGFRVEWGRASKFSPNAFIWFNDKIFIEIFTTLRPMAISAPLMGALYGKEMKERWELWNLRKEGLTDFAIEAADPQAAKQVNLEKVRESILQNGIEVSKIMNGTRKNVRGERVGFGFCGLSPKELPFLVSAYTIPQIPDRIEHPNGIRAIRHITMECQVELLSRFKRLIGDEKKIKIKTGKQTRIQSIAFEGGDINLNPVLLHGMLVED